MNIAIRLVLGIAAIFLMALMVLVFFSELTFGYGLADWFYLGLTAIALVIVTIVYYSSRHANFDERTGLGLTIAGGTIATVLLFSYWITFDRGPEFRWNGYIFRSSSYAAWQEQKQLEQTPKITPVDSVDQSF